MCISTVFQTSDHVNTGGFKCIIENIVHTRDNLILNKYWCAIFSAIKNSKSMINIYPMSNEFYWFSNFNCHMWALARRDVTTIFTHKPEPLTSSNIYNLHLSLRLMI